MKQSKVVYSLNHDIMASFPLGSHQELPKSDPALAVLWCKGALICLCTSLKGAKTFYICSMWMREAIKGGLQRLKHDIIASFPLDSQPVLLNTSRPQQGNSVRVLLYAYIPH